MSIGQVVIFRLHSKAPKLKLGSFVHRHNKLYFSPSLGILGGLLEGGTLEVNAKSEQDSARCRLGRGITAVCCRCEDPEMESGGHVLGMAERPGRWNLVVWGEAGGTGRSGPQKISEEREFRMNSEQWKSLMRLRRGWYTTLGRHLPLFLTGFECLFI